MPAPVVRTGALDRTDAGWLAPGMKQDGLNFRESLVLLLVTLLFVGAVAWFFWSLAQEPARPPDVPRPPVADPLDPAR